MHGAQVMADIAPNIEQSRVGGAFEPGDEGRPGAVFCDEGDDENIKPCARVGSDVPELVSLASLVSCGSNNVRKAVRVDLRLFRCERQLGPVVCCCTLQRPSEPRLEFSGAVYRLTKRK